MHAVTIVFRNGNIVSFDAQEFEIDLTTHESKANKYTYTNAEGEEASVYLTPKQIAGITLTVADPRSNRLPVYYQVGRGGASSNQD